MKSFLFLIVFISSYVMGFSTSCLIFDEEQKRELGKIAIMNAESSRILDEIIANREKCR